MSLISRVSSLSKTIVSGNRFTGKYLGRKFLSTVVSKQSKTKFHSKFILSIAGLTSVTLGLMDQQDLLLNDSRKKKHRVIILDDDEEEENEDDEDDYEKAERIRQENIANKPSLSTIFSINDFEAVAKAVLPYSAWGYYSTGSDDEFSLRENHYAYGRIFFRPKCLTDVTNVSLETTMFGVKFDAPFYITAFAGSPIAHPDAELNLIRAAYKEKIPHMIPFQVSYPLDEFMAQAGEGQDNFYQVHFYTKEQLDNAVDFFKKIETNYKNVKAVFINVDLPALGNREKDNKIRTTVDPESADSLTVFASADIEYKVLTWDDIIKINNSTKLPIALKGVLRKEDVLKAAEVGLAGALISNHGGRQLDFACPPVEILAQTKKLFKEKNFDGSNFHIFVDGGVRRGSDIIKALCLGATGVGMGRPFLYAMSGYGQPGVERAIQILKTEMIRDMKLLGVSSINELNEDMVDIESLKYKGIQTSDSLYNTNYIDMPTPTFRRKN